MSLKFAKKIRTLRFSQNYPILIKKVYYAMRFFHPRETALTDFCFKLHVGNNEMIKTQQVTK